MLILMPGTSPWRPLLLVRAPERPDSGRACRWFWAAGADVSAAASFTHGRRGCSSSRSSLVASWRLPPSRRAWLTD